MKVNQTAGKALLTLLGRSTWALINTYYALLAEKAYHPHQIIIITEEPYKEQLDKAREGLEILSAAHGFTPEISEISLPSSSFIEAGKKISTLVMELKANDYEIAIDITGGRKALVAGTLLSIANQGVNHVFYLAIDSLDDASKPYMMIPLSIQHLRDFTEEAERIRD